MPRMTLDHAHCTGCGACVQRCPKACISFQKEELGHIYPVIDEDTCINCGLCERVCPIEKPKPEPVDQKAYAVVNKDEQVLQNSTSGGFFSAVATMVLAEGGVVYGCIMTSDFQTCHVRAESMEDLHSLRSSKYVQSDTKNTFAEAEKDLRSGRKVLFTGTPCQIDGLNFFLGKEYEDLLTIDIVCHGVGSQAFFDKYMQYKQSCRPIDKLYFRSKEFVGWSHGGMEIDTHGQHHPYYEYDNYYYYYFLHGGIFRNSCYTCKYANTDRPGDFTMGDFWGVETCDIPFETSKGCSLVLANTEKAHRLMPQLEKYIFSQEVSIEQAVRRNGQLQRPSKCSEDRDILVKEYETKSGQELNDSFRKTKKKDIWKIRLKTMVPYKIKVKLRKLR